jgi:putative ABC transport system permease protein
MTLPTLGPLDLVLAGVFAALAGGLSLAAGLKLERQFAIAFLRMVVQLALVGIVLKFVFEQSNWLWTAGVAIIMLVIASFEATARVKLGPLRRRAFGLALGTLSLVAVTATVFTTAAVIRHQPWYQPGVLLPLLGMILGNALSAMGLVLTTLRDSVTRDRRAIETQLALGATRFEAMKASVKSSLATGLTPVINMLAVAGVVSLPGMMTGQILAGADPVEAAKYQIMILAVLAGTAALAAIGGAIGGVLLFTDSRDRLRVPVAD